MRLVWVEGEGQFPVFDAHFKNGKIKWVTIIKDGRPQTRDLFLDSSIGSLVEGASKEKPIR